MKFPPLRFWLVVAALLLLFLYLVKSILLPFAVGLLAGYFLDPAADRLERWGTSRTAATFILTLVFFFLLFLGCVLLVPVLLEQLAGLVDSLPSILKRIQEYLAPLDRMLKRLPADQVEQVKAAAAGDLTAPAASLAGNFAKGLLDSGIALVNLVSLIFITPVVTFFMLRDWDVLVAKVDTLLPRAHAKTIREQMREVDRTLSGFIHGQITVCFMLGIFYAIGLSLVGLNFGFVVGLFTGLATIIPYAGMLFGMVLGLGIALAQFGEWMDVGLVLLVFVIGQVIESNFVTPMLVGGKVGLHPLWMIFGMLAGAALFGFVGILLAVPVTAIIGVWVRFALRQYLQSQLYKDTGKS